MFNADKHSHCILKCSNTTSLSFGASIYRVFFLIFSNLQKYEEFPTWQNLFFRAGARRVPWASVAAVAGDGAMEGFGGGVGGMGKVVGAGGEAGDGEALGIEDRKSVV